MTGIYQRGLFRDLPNRERHLKLMEQFNTGPTYGLGLSLHTQTMPDTCALLSSFLSSLGHPLLPSSLFKPFYDWCVAPSVQDEPPSPKDISPQARWQLSRRSTSEYILLRGIDDEKEANQILVAQGLLRMLPPRHISLFIYLCAFFTQIPLTPENGLTFDDIGNLFGVRLVGGVRSQARSMLVWILMRWQKIFDTLFNDVPVVDDAFNDPCSRRCSTNTQNSVDSWKSSSSRDSVSTTGTSIYSHDEDAISSSPSKLTPLQTRYGKESVPHMPHPLRKRAASTSDTYLPGKSNYRCIDQANDL